MAVCSFSLVLLNEAIADLVNAHARLDISQAWGDGTAVAADGTHMDTYLDNLLAETSVRYGKPGGIAYHHISDTYIALFTHFIPCGVWEAVYIIEGLLKNASEVKPTTVHAARPRSTCTSRRCSASRGRTSSTGT